MLNPYLSPNKNNCSQIYKSIGEKKNKHSHHNNKFYLKRISYQIKAKHLLAPAKKNDLAHYVQIVQREFNLHAVELYDANSKRITYSLSPELDGDFFKTVSAGNLQKENPPKGVWTISEGLSAGEIIRTIGTVPFGANRIDTKAFIVLSILISSDLSENMKSISRGVEEYQQIKLLKKPVQATYYITLSIVGLLVVFCAVWFGFFLAKSISIPIKELAEGTRRVAEGDLSFSIGIVADDEIGSLVDSFNKMTRDLRFGRDQIELSARMLREQNVEIEEERQYMEIVLKNISAGVITLDAGGFVATINKSAEKMLDLKSNEILNKSYKNLLKGRHLNLAKEIMASLASSRKNFVELLTRMTVAGMPRSFMVHLNELKNDAGRHIGIVMVIDDLTELEKAQRMIAWREVARRIAHEVKNPLTPITLSAQRLNRKYSERLNESVFDECIHMIIDHVELIRNLVNEFSVFARFPTANPKPCDLPAIIKETVALYKEGHQHINIEIYISDNIPPLNLDRQQIKQAIINLIDNAIGAIKDQGRIVISLTHDPILKMVRIEVADDGTGVSDEVKTRLFEPNFSTKKGGMGLGLTIVSAIVSDHNGMISVQDNQPRGAKIIIELPV